MKLLLNSKIKLLVSIQCEVMHMLMTLIYIKCISYDTDFVPLAKQVIYYQTQCN